jgi:hypothetical protein
MQAATKKKPSKPNPFNRLPISPPKDWIKPTPALPNQHFRMMVR